MITLFFLYCSVLNSISFSFLLFLVDAGLWTPLQGMGGGGPPMEVYFFPRFQSDDYSFFFCTDAGPWTPFQGRGAVDPHGISFFFPQFQSDDCSFFCTGAGLWTPLQGMGGGAVDPLSGKGAVDPQ